MKYFALLLFLCTTALFSQINNDHLNVGEKAPAIIGKDQNGKPIDSKVILKSQKILLVFYRGNWCPNCRKHLKELQTNLAASQSKGVFVLVVTPEKVEKTIETQDKLKTEFSIVHDVDNTIMTAYKVAYKVNKSTVTSFYNLVEKNIAAYNTTDNTVLPVPATYLINTDGKIIYVQYDTNHKVRSDIKMIIEKYL